MTSSFKHITHFQYFTWIVALLFFGSSMATTSVLVEYSDCDTNTEQGDLGEIWEVYDSLEDDDPVFRIPKYTIPFEDSKPSYPFIFHYQFSLNLAELSPFFLDGTICTNAP